MEYLEFTDHLHNYGGLRVWADTALVALANRASITCARTY